MAVKAKPKKAAGISKRAKTSPRQIREWVEQWNEQAQARLRISMDAYNAQDAETQEILDRIRDRLVIGATGLIRLPDGSTYKVESEIVGAHAMYVAVEILKDLAVMGVRVGKFKFPDAYCADCGVKLRDTKKGRARRGRA